MFLENDDNLLPTLIIICEIMMIDGNCLSIVVFLISVWWWMGGPRDEKECLGNYFKNFFKICLWTFHSKTKFGRYSIFSVINIIIRSTIIIIMKCLSIVILINIIDLWRLSIWINDSHNVRIRGGRMWFPIVSSLSLDGRHCSAHHSTTVAQDTIAPLGDYWCARITPSYKWHHFSGWWRQRTPSYRWRW